MLRKALDWHKPLMLFTLVMIALVPITGLAMLVDDRTLDGAPIWFKPFKFAVSFALYGVTLSWALSLPTKARKVGGPLGTIIAITSTIEMVIIVGQAARGQHSHFNVSTAFDRALFIAMGLSVMFLWTSTAVIAALVAFSRFVDKVAGTALRYGLLISVAGLSVGFLMLVPTPDQIEDVSKGVNGVIGGHSVGVRDGGPSMAATGWNTTGGDLRVPHFFGMHALQALPLFAAGLGFVRSPRLADERTRSQLVRLAAGLYAGLFVLTLWQSLRGQAVTSPDAPTLIALAALLAVVGLGVVRALKPTPSAVPA
ncbi:MAG TPA: hypothetical protein VNO31_12555 [Umezawaea sp.]|nr:hypothetical protein [Umezawaea sp.]